MAQLFRNNAFSNLGASLTNVATTLTVTAGHGDRFPVVTAPDFCLLTLQDASNNIEIVKVTARTAGSDSMTIQRAQEGTTARAWNIGDVVELRLTASALGPLSLFEGASTAAAIRSAIGALSLAGGTLTGKLTTAAPAAGGAGISLPHGVAPTTPVDGDVWTTTSGLFARVNGATKTIAFTDSSITGNAATATKLQTASTINGTSFDGSANITTANWGTARTITIGNTGKSVDGSTNVSWSLAEIGVTAATETASGIVELATAAEVQAGTDNTRAVTPAGAMGLVNMFGLGGAAAGVPGNNIDATSIPTGFYYVTTATSGTKPTGDDGFGHLIVSREGTGTTARQLYLDNASARICTRVYVNAAWSEWRDLYHIPATHNIVGLVQVATGGGAGTYVRIDENFELKTTDAAFFSLHPTYAGIIKQIIDGQSMIKIPKFYFKAGTVPSGNSYAGRAYWMISDKPAAGFSVHPAFIGPNGVELDQIWVGKYQASSSGGKLQSVPGVAPRVSMDFPTARAEAYARNVSGVSGFRLWSYYDLAAIQMLATIEMGGLDMQALIGQGRVSTSSAANVDAADVAQATWRGIVGLWGNVWQMVDGIKRNGGNWWRWQYNAPGNTTTSDFATGYVNTGRAAPTSNGYPVTFDATLLAAGIIVPATVDGTASNGSTGDHSWSTTDTDDRVACHGGAWGDGANAGLFSLVASNAPSSAGSIFGCRLAKV